MFLKVKSWFYQNDDEVFDENYKCCARGCNYQSNDESEDYRLMYKFPKSKDDIDKWLHNLKLDLENNEPWQEVKDLRVCSIHFEELCKNRDSLRAGSVPTLNLGHSQIESLHHNNIKKCSIEKCAWENFGCHKLPEDESLKNCWSTALTSGSWVNNIEYMCSVHLVSSFERLEESPAKAQLNELYNKLKVLPELRVFKCCVYSCCTGFKMNEKLFEFPKEAALLQKWLHNTSMIFNIAERPQYRICARHFEERCLSEKKLHRWALPTLELPFNASLYVNPPEALPSHHENLQHCCVSSCNTEKGPFFKFPSKSVEAKKWIHNLELGQQQSTLNLRICHKHFESYCLSRDDQGEIKKLKNWAIPTLNLTKTEGLHDNPPQKVDFFCCCVCHVVQNKSEGIYLFRFPTRLASFLKWLHNLKMSRNEYRDSMRICLKHFENECFDKRLRALRKHSVPTIAISCPVEDMFKNPQRKPHRKCCVTSCEGPWTDLYTFPKEKIPLKKWLFNLKIKEPEVESDLRSWKICQKHFESRCINSHGRIRLGAVPTLNLGHDSKFFRNPQLFKKVVNTKPLLPKNRRLPIGKSKIRGSKAKSEKSDKRKHLKDEAKKLPMTHSKIKVEKQKRHIQKLEVVKEEAEITSSDNLDNYQTLGDYIRERKLSKCKRSAAGDNEPKISILQNTKKRKISKKFLPLKQEPESKPLFEIISEKSTHIDIPKIEETENSMSILPNVYIKQEPVFDVKLESIDEAQPAILEEPNERPNSALKLNALAQKCSVPGCLNGNNAPGCVFFKFPSSVRLRTIWTRHCQQKCKFALTLTKKRKVCCVHFEKESIIENRLLLGAIPTLRLGEDVENLDNCGELLKEFRHMRCRIDSCQRSIEIDQIHKIPFPHNEELRKKWCFNININENEISEEDWLCHKHFERRALDNKRSSIKEGSVPTLLLGPQAPSVEELHKNPEYIDPKKLYSQLRQVCCVSTCPNTRQISGLRFASFPKRKDIYEKWLHNLDLQDSADVRNCYNICWQHFEEVCYSKYNYLKIGSIPTLKLEKQENIIALDESQLVEVDTYGRRIKHQFIQKKYECVHPLCTEGKSQVFRGPQIEEIKKLWLTNIKVPETPPGGEEDINFCDEHFYVLYKTYEENLSQVDQELYKKELHSLSKTYKELAEKSKFFSKHCMIAECPTDQYMLTYKNVKLHNFPLHSEISKKWCHNCDIDYNQLDKTKPNYYKLCERHFESFCYAKRSLFSWALPTLNLPSTKRPEDVLQIDPEDKCAYTGVCCVSTCINANGYKFESKTRLYKFPQNPQVLAKWLQNVKCENFQANETKICGLHFRARFLKKRRKLLDSAIPTLRLGLHDKDLIINVDEEEMPDPENDQEPEEEEEEVKEKSMFDEGEDSKDADWNDHDYCHGIDRMEKSGQNEMIPIKQELIEDQYGLDEEQQQEAQYEDATTTSLIKEEVLDIEDTHEYSDHKASDHSDDYEYRADPFTQSPNELNIQNCSSLVISEVKSRIFLCCVQKCSNSSEIQGIKLYTEFPSDSEIFIKWCFNIKIDPRNYKENQYAICSDHFESMCFSDALMSLYSWAVPTLNLNLPENSFIHQNDPPSEQCIVYGCIQPMMPLFKFPLRLDLCQKWFANLKLDLTDYRAQNYRICRRHFITECFDVNNLLKTESIPTLFLGHADNVAHYNTFEKRPQEQDTQADTAAPNAECSSRGVSGAIAIGDALGLGVGPDNSRGSSQGSLARNIISPHDLEDHDSSYYEDFEECYGVDE